MFHTRALETLAPEEPRGTPWQMPSVLMAFHFIPSLFSPSPLSNGHWGFPTLRPSNWDPPRLWKATWSFLPVLVKRVPQSRGSSWDKL